MKNHLLTGSVFAAALFAAISPSAEAQTVPYMGMLKTFGFDYCPQGWVDAGGQLYAISSNPALFSLFGTMYGGNGVTTFAVPNLNSRFPTHFGTGPGLDPVFWGQAYGTSSHTLSVAQMPAHSHAFNATTTLATEVNPTGRTVGSFVSAAAYAVAGSSTVAMNTQSVAPQGGSMPFGIQDPYLALNFCVNLDGVYPPRN